LSEYDVVIKGGTVIDGLRTPRRRADLAIKNGIVTEIGPVKTSDAGEVIDASGLIVAPGFVDLHTHYDSQLFWDPYLSVSGWHGVTSAVIGNCGFGFAPVRPEFRERAMLTMTKTEAVPLACMQEGLPWNWVTFPEFLNSVDAAPKAVNVLPYLPLSPLLIWVMGFDRAKAGELPTDEEHAEMGRLLAEALDNGAAGISAQRGGANGGQKDYDGTPMVTDIMHDETMLYLASILRDRNTGTIQYTHQNEQHLEDVARLSGRPVITPPLGDLLRPGVFNREGEGAAGWLEKCRAEGLGIYPQTITNELMAHFSLADPFQTWETSPGWKEALLGSLPLEEKLRRIADPAVRDRMRADVPMLVPGLILYVGKSPETARWNETQLKDIASALGKDVTDTFCDICLADAGMTEWLMWFPLNLDRMRKIIDNPYILAGISDGGAHTKYTEGGCYTTHYITKYVRELGWISLEEAHWRLSTYQAYVGGFQGRGYLAPGMAADVIVYDYDAIGAHPSEVTHDYPGGEWRRVNRAMGYRYILVNGQVTIQDDKETGVHAGHLVRGGELGRSRQGQAVLG
jgi:N-acyl-D-amino-acid deacylase